MAVVACIAIFSHRAELLCEIEDWLFLLHVVVDVNVIELVDLSVQTLVSGSVLFADKRILLHLFDLLLAEVDLLWDALGEAPGDPGY